MLAEQPPRDPIDVKEQDRERARKDDAAKKATAKSTATTLQRYARAYHAAHIEPIRADRHGQEWLKSIERHAPAGLLVRDRAAAVDTVQMRNRTLSH